MTLSDNIFMKARQCGMTVTTFVSFLDYFVPHWREDKEFVRELRETLELEELEDGEQAT